MAEEQQVKPPSEIPEVVPSKKDPSKGTVKLSDGSVRDMIYNEEFQAWETATHATDEELKQNR